MGKLAKGRQPDALLQRVIDGFKRATKMPTPGMIQKYVKDELNKKLDYAEARALQGRFKRWSAKQVGPATVYAVETASQGRMRHSKTHG